MAVDNSNGKSIMSILHLEHAESVTTSPLNTIAGINIAISFVVYSI